MSTTPASTSVLYRSRQIVTRYQERRIRNTFPFLRLPAELRNLIYGFSLDASAAQNIIGRYYEDLRDTTDAKSVKAPLIWSKCPTIFLLNRQVYAESFFFVRKCSLTFDHGLLDLLTVNDFVPESLVRNVTSITVNDTGHPLFKDNILAASWMGYITLIEQLAEILAPGHKLKNLTISLAHEELVPHVTDCWHANYTCGFRDSLRRACNALRRVRNVGNVTLVGFPQSLAADLKARMEAAPINLLDLPRELRDMIYGEALDWSDISQQLKRTMVKWTDKTNKPPYPKRSTSTILLLNRQITSEALTVLHAMPLALVCPGDHNMQKQHQVPNMLRFITRATLQHVQHLHLKIESWEWIYSLDHLLPVFAATYPHPNYPTVNGRQQHGNNLKSVHIYFTDNLKARFLADVDQVYPDNTLHTSLSGLAKIRGLKQVTFHGDLPACYTVPLAQIMQMPASIGDAGLPRLQALRASGEVVDVKGDDD
ncbi:hypothetical protein LTR85_004405 [Meristemomyces frigidus]|nr:hypothetical protein LTR85_004405 [Meristemomyces frigidus]